MADYYRWKSLDEMLESIDIGMDIEFYLYNVRYNLSWRNNKPFIWMCPEGDAIFYDSSEQMFNEYKVNGKALKELWKDFKMIFMWWILLIWKWYF